jgi:hypothetical protein
MIPGNHKWCPGYMYHAIFKFKNNKLNFQKILKNNPTYGQ